MKQTNKNFIFNVGYQLLMYLFPLISAAYVSRVLGSENIGIYSYVNSIVTVFGMFCLLGIANYGNRECAKVRDDRGVLSTVFSSVYTLQLILSAVVLIAYVAVVFLLPLEHKPIFLIQFLHILSAACNVTWLYFGLEKFKIALTRNFIVKVVSTLMIIVFVKSEQDLWIYTLIMTASTFVSQVFLLLLARREVDFRPAPIQKAFSHFKSCCILFIPVIAFSVYRIMDKIMIGGLSSKSQLGFYDNAERIINIPIMVISALGTVMMPHMAHAMENKTGDYKKTISFSMKLALSIAVFSALGLIVVGKDLSVMIYGQEYLFSGYLIIALACTIIASAWANVIRTQYLIPKSLDNIYVISTIIGAVINLLFNTVLIKPYGAMGACVGTILAEFSIVIYQTLCVRNHLQVKIYIKDFAMILVKAVPVMAVVYLLGIFIQNIYLRVILQICLAVMLFVLVNCRFILGEFFGLQKYRNKTK